MLPLDTSVQAEYEDGYILDETALDDVSQFVEGKNVFHDILNRLPEEAHGRLVRFSVFWDNQRYDVDWTTLPDNARPIRFRHGYITRNVDGSLLESGWSGVDFGFQYNDEDGANQQEVLNLGDRIVAAGGGVIVVKPFEIAPDTHGFGIDPSAGDFSTARSDT